MTLRPHLTALSVIRTTVSLLVALSTCGLGAAGASAQDVVDGPGRWNAPDALELVERARIKRTRTFRAVDLENYRARADGFVYFFLERPGEDENTLIKADQLALDIFWMAPNQTRQRIVGMRDEKLLPTNINYHLDHLTVVQDEFPDRIRLGDGDEVSDVVHPVAPGSGDVYDFRLAGSLTISFSAGMEPVRVHEVQVKPKEMDRPGFVGSVFLDETNAAIVRMRFTFTPASYVDPHLDYIRISLENALWMGEHWLPYRQDAEIRRELPQLDFMAGSIIRGRFEIGGYRFDEELPDDLFLARGVSSVPAQEREAFPFDAPLFSQLDEEGLTPPPSMGEIRESVAAIVQDRYMSGLGRARFHISSASDVYRFDRAEGHVVGVGATFVPASFVVAQLRGGYAFGSERPVAGVTLAHPEGGGLEFEGYLNRPRDIGPLPGPAGVINTLGGVLFDEDWTDPYFVSGGTVRRALPAGAPGSEIGLRIEEQRSATLVANAEDFRSVRPVDDGTLIALDLEISVGGGDTPDAGPGASVRVEQGLEIADTDFGHTRLTGTAAWRTAHPWYDVTAGARLDGGWTSDGAPPQALFLLGGRGSLLGHDTRAFVGDRFWLLRTEATRTLSDPLLTLRLFAGAGRASLEDGLPTGWTGEPDAGVKGSVGLGLGLFWDVLRLDFGHGLGGGGFGELAFGVDRRFHGWL